MKCHKLNDSKFITRWWHRLLCPECRHAQHLDTMIGFGLMQMKSEPLKTKGLDNTLSVLDLQTGGQYARQASRRLAGDWLRRQTRLAGMALVLGGVWWQYMNYIPPIKVPVKTPPAQNASDYFKLAGKMVSANKELTNEIEEARQLPSDLPTRERRDARLKHEGKPIPSLAEFQKLAKQNSIALTLVRTGDHPGKFDTVVYSSAALKMLYTLEEKQQLLDDNRLALTILREGLKYPYMDVYERRFDTMFPYYADFRQMARLLSLEASVKAEQGDWNGAMQSSLDAMQMGVDIGHGGPVIARLVGIACEAIGQQGAWKAVEHLDAPQVKAAIARLQVIRAAHAPFVDTLQEEKLSMQEGLRDQMQKPDWRANFGRISGNDEPRSFQLATLGWSNRIILKDIAAGMDENIRRSRLPYAQSKNLPEFKEPFDPIAMILFPIFSQAQYRDIYTSETQSALLVTTLALHAYSLEHGGQFPSRLEQLTPAYLAQIPADPFGNSNETLRYANIAASKVWDASVVAALQAPPFDRSGTPPYLLYSIGPDGKDNGGQPVDLLHQSGREADASWRKFMPNDKNRFQVMQTAQGDIVAGVNTQ